MIPLSDNSPNHKVPIVTYAFIALCVVVYILQTSGGAAAFEASVMTYGFTPANFFGSEGTLTTPYGYTENLPNAWLTMFTSMFMHGSLAHIGGNLLYLWVFGDNIENHLGKLKFIAFYLATGAAACLAQGLVDTTSTIPMVGASGAISGVLGAYFLLHPKQPITVLVPNAGIVNLPAWMMIGLWFGYQLLLGLMSDSSEGGVAFFAHIGGFVAGFLLIIPFLRLSSRPTPKPQLWK